jgi:hypothetical protein
MSANPYGRLKSVRVSSQELMPREEVVFTLHAYPVGGPTQDSGAYSIMIKNPRHSILNVIKDLGFGGTEYFFRAGELKKQVRSLEKTNGPFEIAFESSVTEQMRKDFWRSYHNTAKTRDIVSVHYKGVMGMEVVHKDIGNGIRKPFLYVYGDTEGFVDFRKKDSDVAFDFLIDGMECALDGEKPHLKTTITKHFVDYARCKIMLAEGLTEVREGMGYLTVLFGDNVRLAVDKNVPAALKRELADIRAKAMWSRWNYGESDHSADMNFFIDSSRVPLVSGYDYDRDQRFRDEPTGQAPKKEHPAQPGTIGRKAPLPGNIETFGKNEIM